MGEAIAIILEYLRRHSFTKAEAALEAELLGRQGTSGSNPFTFNNDVDHEPKITGAYSSSDNVFEYGAQNILEPLYDEPNNSFIDEDDCKGARFELFTGKKLAPLEFHAEEPEPESENSVISARNSNIMESKIKIDQRGVKDAMKVEHKEPDNVPLLPKQGNEGQNGLIENCLLQISANDSGPIEKIINVQNDIEEKDFEMQYKGGTHFGSRSHRISATQTDGTESSRQVKNGSQCVNLHDDEGGTQYLNNMLHQTSCSKATRRWEELDGLLLREFTNDSSESDIGNPKIEISTAGQESAQFVRRKPSNDKMALHMGLPLMKCPDNQCGDLASDCYKIAEENSCYDSEQSKHCSLTSHGKAPPVKTGYPFLFSYPSQEFSLAEMKQQEQQIDWINVEGANTEKKDPGFGEKECLQEALLPWESNMSSEVGILGCFEDKKATSERRCKDVPRFHHGQTHTMGKSSDWYQENASSFNFANTSDDPFDGDVCLEPSFELGSYSDVPLGQDLASSGNKRRNEICYPSITRGVIEDTPELLSGFATLKDSANDSGAEYPQEYWESDGYDNDDDPGYHRQPIEDEAWFLAHEIDYPSDDERAKCNSLPKKDSHRPEDDERSLMEEESYFSGEQLYKLDESEPIPSFDARDCTDSSTDFNERLNGNHIMGFNQLGRKNYDYQITDDGCLELIRSEPAWKGFSENSQLGCEKVMLESNRWREEASLDIDDDRQGSIRSGGLGMGSDVADYGSELRDSLLGCSSEGDFESVRDREMVSYMAAERRLRRENHSHKQTVPGHTCSGSIVNNSNGTDAGLQCYSKGWEQGCDFERQLVLGNNYSLSEKNIHGRLQEDEGVSGFCFGGFSFPSSSTGDMLGPKVDTGKLIEPGEDRDSHCKGISGPDDTLASWKRKSNESSPILSPKRGTLMNQSLHSSQSAHSSDGFSSRGGIEGTEMVGDNNNENDGNAIVVDDEDAAAVQEQIRRIKADEDEYEVFNLRIIHRRNRTGFEEDKDFPVVVNSVVAGRYHVTEYLGSAAFSKAIQAHDLRTGQDVCMKIIKNNKDFFDQSLDEIKLLKYINRHDPADKFHVLRLYDYFYFCEHLFIVCELLRANLYEFHKFNRESGAEVYFTMPRLQSIARQCLEALEFLHSLGLIHCDLKPENILVKSYSRCEVKVIDFGSSCFQTDHLCPYVQSRSYRAPEVILGLSYNQKIDIWSLGCILAELCSGNVLFQNESLTTLLARVVGIIGPIDPEMMSKGRDVHKYFTKNHMLYETNQDTNQLEYLLPKKTSLRHRLPVGDQGFVDFVGYLLQINPENRPSATEALKHPWLSHPYEPISS